MKKRALAVLSSPKTLCDFIWFYLEFGNQYDWDVLIRNEGSVSKWVEKTDIFHSIYYEKTKLQDYNIFFLLVLFTQMVFYWLIGHSEKLASKIIDEQTDGKKYDLYVVVPFGALISGLVFLLGKNRNVVILEDGTGDYLKRYNCWMPENPLNFNYFVGYLLGKMGYADLTFQYELKSLKNCVKCARYPERLDYTGYREIRKIGVFSDENQKKYNDLIRAIFGINEIDAAEAVLYTTSFSDFTQDNKLITLITEKTVNYINTKYSGKKIILKCHPRDKQEYKFNSDVQIILIDSSIPGELIENLLAGKHHQSVLMFVSTIIQSLQSNDYTLLFFQDLACSKQQKRPYNKIFRDSITQLNVNQNNVEIVD